jgi:PhoP regulatory network protein YrbL
MIRLEHLQPVGRGSHRMCFVHPHRPDRCLKIMIADSSSADAYRGLKKSAFGFPGTVSNENLLEFEAYQDLEKLQNPAIWRHIPRCHGMLATDLGPALVTDYIRNPDGQGAETLAQRLARNYDKNCEMALVEFKTFLLDTLIRIGDLHPSNLMICRTDETKRERIYIVDGLATRHFLWWPLFYPFRRFKVRRKIRRLEHRIHVLNSP